MKKILLSALLVVLTASAAEAGILISEVFYDPPGSNDSSLEWIELYNDSLSSLDLTGYELNSTIGDYYVFTTIIAAQGCIVLHWNCAGTDTQTELYTGISGFANMGNTSGWTALFNSSVHSSSTIIDYLEYGAGGKTWESAAAGAGIWTTGDYITDVEEGHSLEYLGTGNTSLDWRDQANPAPGNYIPEPSALVLFSSGLAALLMSKKRKRLPGLFYNG